jgi:putative SOS response-associated peptidase YedK
MCGRYSLHTNKKKLAKAIAQEIPEAFEPCYNIGPGSEILVIAKGSKQTAASGMMHWGLRTPQNFHINARLETADSTPRFRESWAEQRCLVPANGFYEWYEDGITKQPYYIYPLSDELMFFAGLWFPSASPTEPAHCVLLTTTAHSSITDVHQRMPVTLPKSVHADWLSNELPKDEVLAFSQKINFQKHMVSSRVNHVQNKDSRLIVATTPQNDDQMQLF